MLTKLFITAAAAAALSVPLAGAAWADPPSGNNPPGHGVTGPGVPHEAGATLDAITAVGQSSNPDLPNINPNGTGLPVPPGKLFNEGKDQFKTDPLTGKNIPGVSTPDAFQAFVGGVYRDYLGADPAASPNGFAPGHATKSLTPGCSRGSTGIVNGTSVCN